MKTERRAHHGTPHIGRFNIDHLLEMQPATVSNPMKVTLADLENLAVEISGKHELALFKMSNPKLSPEERRQNAVWVENYEQQIEAIAQHASVLADPDN